MADEPRWLGVISDTHGLMRAEALDALRGVDLIVHAGDVGKPDVLDSLRTIAPTVAIRGNIDKTPPCSLLPATEIVEAGSLLIYVLHDVHELDLEPAAAGFAMVVSGHSHQPGQKIQRDVLYLNPGSAGPRRFRLPVTVARVDLHRRPLTAEILPLRVS